MYSLLGANIQKLSNSQLRESGWSWCKFWWCI